VSLTETSPAGCPGPRAPRRRHKQGPLGEVPTSVNLGERVKVSERGDHDLAVAVFREEVVGDRLAPGGQRGHLAAGARADRAHVDPDLFGGEAGQDPVGA
jgi:hypothetical protein